MLLIRKIQKETQSVKNCNRTSCNAARFLERRTFFDILYEFDQFSKGQFPVDGIFRAGGILRNQKSLKCKFLFNYKVTFSNYKCFFLVIQHNLSEYLEDKSIVRFKTHLPMQLLNESIMLTCLMKDEKATIQCYRMKMSTCTQIYCYFSDT